MEQTPNSTPENEQKSSSKKPIGTTTVRRRRKKKMDKAVTVAIIGAAAAIIVGIIGAPSLNQFLLSKLTPSPSPVLPPTQPMVITDTEIPPLATETPTLAIPTSPTNTDTPVIPPTVQLNIEVMTALLTASATEGRTPLNVTFNAKSSYTQFADKSIAPCEGTRLCSFSWTVSGNSKLIASSNTNEGTFSYIFQGKGDYIIAVYVCRGNVCDDEAILVKVK